METKIQVGGLQKTLFPDSIFLEPQTAFSVPKELSFIFTSVFSYPSF